MRPLILGLALAFALSAQSPYDTALKNLKFRSIGPATMGGRIDDFAVVESDPRIIYVGAAAGGVFKTINGGQSWQAIFENQPNPSIGDLALAPSNPSILYVGTGEPNNRQSSSWGNGVYKSTDAGATFTHLGLEATHHIGRIVVHPTDPNIVYVAAQGDLWGPNKERGVYKSTDGGATWQQVLFVNEDTGANDIAIDHDSPNILYATTYQRRRTVFGFSGGGPGSAIYRSTDAGAHWTKLGGATLGRGLPATGDLGRCALDIYRKNTNIVYALVEHQTQGGVYRSEDKGATWTRMGDTNPRPSYFSQIRIDPNNDLRLWMGGVNIYFSEDGGRTFNQGRFRDVHSDNHGIWIDPANSDHVLSGNDGGVWVTWDAGRNWQHIDNIALGQFYEVAFDFQKPYHVCGGLQDNYSWCGPSSTTQSTGIGNSDWITVQGGDGFYNRIDPSDSNIVYAESQDGNLSRRDLRTSESKSIRPLEPTDAEPRYRFQWNSPLMISPHDPKTIYYGGNHLFKSTDRGDNWTVLGEDLTTGAKRDDQKIFAKAIDNTTLSRHDGVVAWPCITAIAESPAKQGVLWVGTDDGNVQLSRDGSKSWSNVASHIMGMPKGEQGGYVSRLEPSHTDQGTVYVTFDNHRNADYGIYIFRSTNFGDSFQRITNGIPPTAGTVHVIREDPVNANLLFAGTEFGLFVTFDRGANWRPMKNGLPTVPVFDVQVHPREHDLILATHGRAIWIMDDIAALEQLNEEVLKSDLKVFDDRPGIQWKMANYRGFMGTSNFLAPNAPSGVTIDYFSKAAGPARIVVADSTGKEIRTINARAEAGVINRASWDMRTNPAVPPAGRGAAGAGGAEAAAGGGGGGRGGRGGGGRGGRGGGAQGTAPAGGEAQAAAAPPQEGGEIQNEFGPAGAAGAAGAAGGEGAAGGGGRGFGGRGGGGGSTVDPGQYKVTVTVAGKSDSRTVKVEEDPRVQFSDEDRSKRRKAVDSLMSMTKEADASRRRAVAMTTALTNLTDSWKGPNAPTIPEAVRKAADDLLAKAKKVAANFEATGGGRGAGGGSAGPPPAYTPPPVTQKIQRLMFSIDGYSAAPTTRQMADIDECAAQLKKGAEEVNALWDEVPKFNKMMADAGVQYFTVNPNNVPAATFGGRGGGE
jgi:photosystem II stability/assembly factor-like uncharacterized protein